MPKLSQLTDYDPMGNFVGAQPVAAPTDTPATPISNNIDKILNSLFRDDEKRMQLWPEKLLRAGTTAAGNVMSGEIPQWSIDPKSGDVHTSPQMVEAAQEMSALAGTGGLGGAGGTLNATPSLRPALRHKEKLYKGKPGQEHQDIIPDSLYNDFQKKAMSGEDLAEYNFGFVNDKGHFLSREDALKYGIDNGLIDPQAGKYGALTSTLFADSSKPGTAIEAMKAANPFFSALEHNVKQVSQSKMTGEQWLGTLGNKPGVKPEELQWTGLADFLAENKGKPVTKAQIEEHLAQNKVELKEVTKGGKNEVKTLAIQLAEKENGKGSWDRIGGGGQEHYWRDAEKQLKQQRPLETKYYNYQLPGGENYREMLLTLPTKRQHIGVSEGEFGGMPIVKQTPSQPYKSSHWDEPNILAHVRMNDRTIDGKKALHLEEIQSDWHQAGREKGYKGLSAEEKARKEALDKKPMNEWSEKDTDWYNSAVNDRSQYGVPDAPFKKNWSELALKKMIREASENGYDRLSWTAGEHHPTNPKNLKQTGPEADKADKGMQGFYNDIIPKVVEKLGKEHGVKVRTSEVNNPYDIVPGYKGKFDVVNSADGKRIKTFDTKAEAEKEVAGRGKKIYYIDIPQTLKDTATQKGFPLFAKGGYMLQPVDFDPFAGKTELKT